MLVAKAVACSSLALLILCSSILRPSEARGVIAVLQKASKLSLLQERNTHLEKMFYREGEVNDFDIVIFCEKYVKPHIQQSLQNASKLPLTFVFVDETLRGMEKQYGKDRNIKSKRLFMDTLCPANGGSARFTFGYKGMCQFWFTDFQQYVTQYDWLVRIDDDCNVLRLKHSLSGTNMSSLFPLPDHVPFAPAHWTRAEYCSSFTALTGMKSFTQDFATRHGLTTRGAPKNISQDVVFQSFKRAPKISGNNECYMMAPYTNVFYINLKWLRADNITQQYMKEVKEISCIFNNRWGDLELWASIHLLLDSAVHYVIPLPYFHKSHGCRCDAYSLAHRHKGEGPACDLPLDDIVALLAGAGVTNSVFHLVDQHLSNVSQALLPAATQSKSQ